MIVLPSYLTTLYLQINKVPNDELLIQWKWYNKKSTGWYTFSSTILWHNLSITSMYGMCLKTFRWYLIIWNALNMIKNLSTPLQHCFVSICVKCVSWEIIIIDTLTLSLCFSILDNFRMFSVCNLRYQMLLLITYLQLTGSDAYLL